MVGRLDDDEEASFQWRRFFAGDEGTRGTDIVDLSFDLVLSG
jgi:hypothetical protein